MIRQGAVFAIAFFVSAFALCCRMPGDAADILKDIPWKIDEPAARLMAAEAKGDEYRPDQFRVSLRHKSPPFFVLDLLNRPGLKGVAGFYAVNPWTGDVWNLLGCYELMTPDLLVSKLEIRKRFGHEELKHYDELDRIKPECVYEDW